MPSVPRIQAVAQKLVAPPHISGHRSLTGLRLRLDSPAQADEAFRGMIDHFQHPDRWFRSMPMPHGARLHYRLADATGTSLPGRAMQVGDYGVIQLGTIGPGDWVRTEALAINAAEGWGALTVRSAPSARVGVGDGSRVMHFYERPATNTMTIFRDGNDIAASIDVRNGIANTGAQAYPSRSLRNRAVVAGLHAGAHKGAWTAWTLEHLGEGLRAAEVSPKAILAQPSRIIGASGLVPVPLRDVSRHLRGLPTVAQDDAALAAQLIA